MENKLAIVTGGSSGIGAEFARQLAQKGYDLLLVSNQPEALEAMKVEIEQLAPEVTCNIMNQNLATADAAEMVINRCREIGKDPEVLINNAGIFTFKEILDHDERYIDLYINLHVATVARLCYTVGKMMREKGHGYILNMSSMSVWMPMPTIGFYASTKAFIRVFTRSLHYELRDHGVKVMVACPGGLATDLFGLPKKWQKVGVAIGALTSPHAFVKGALKRLFKGKKQYVNGLFNRISIVAVASLPTWFIMWAKHKILEKIKR